MTKANFRVDEFHDQKNNETQPYGPIMFILLLKT